MVGFNLKRRNEERNEEKVSDKEPFAVMAIFLINALVMMLIAGQIYHAVGISQSYSERIQAINPEYLNLVAQGNTIAAFLMVFSLVDVFLAAYFYLEWKAIRIVKIKLEGT
jgi:uncharacterized membrane protein (DUF373 family)